MNERVVGKENLDEVEYLKGRLFAHRALICHIFRNHLGSTDENLKLLMDLRCLARERFEKGSHEFFAGADEEFDSIVDILLKKD